LLGSCTDQGPETISKQTIVNNSNKEIVITSFLFDYNTKKYSFSKKIILKNNDIIHEETKVLFSSPEDALTFEKFVGGDSIVIDYVDKIKSYSSRTDDDNRDPYYLDSQNKNHDFVYTITPEDYANATPK
jgi:hypothetical protein